MTAKKIASTAVKAVQTGLISTMIFQLAIGSAFAVGQTEASVSRDNATTTVAGVGFANSGCFLGLEERASGAKALIGSPLRPD
jgi:hypothetical protein